MALNGYTGDFRMVDPKVVIFDHRYQRTLKNTLVAKISQAPSWEAFGVPVCFERDNGMLYCADGQQRIAGVMASEKPPKEIPVVVFKIEDLKDEAEVFGLINEWRKALMPLEKHKARIVSGNESALAIERAVATAGFTIDNASGSGAANARTIQAVAAINYVYNRIGEEGVLQTLTCIREAWGNDQTQTKRQILRGVAELIEEQGAGYNRTKLINALKKSTPSDLLREAKRLSFDFGGTTNTQMRRAFASLCGLKMPREQAKEKAAA